MRHILFLTCILLTTAFSKAQTTKKNTPTKHPNIVFLLADDLRKDAVGFMGNSVVKTPNLDSLARKSFVFENAYVTTSLCAASRASILTGQYGARHGIVDFIDKLDQKALSNTYPAILKANGYQTAFVGKYGVGNPTQSEIEVLFDDWKGFEGQGNYWVPTDGNTYKHLTRKLEEEAIQFLETRDTTKPFCLSVSFKAPHVENINEFTPDPEYQRAYWDDSIPPPRHGTTEDYQLFPEFFRKNSESRSRWKTRFPTYEVYRENVKKYYRLITGLDRAVGEIIRQLDKEHLLENTVIIFASDNGFFLGEHGLAGKWFEHRESIEVPFFIYDPRETLSTKKKISVTALNIDIAPTILALANLRIPNGMQGTDLTPILKNQKITPRDYFWYEQHFGYEGKIPKVQGIIGKRYKYVKYYEQPEYISLFDLKKDPYETKNLLYDKTYAKLIPELEAKYNAMKAEVSAKDAQ